MEYKFLGKTGVRVSQLCFGTMSFGGDADRNESEAMFRKCLDAGINFFDCADIYQKGTAEEILGNLVKGMRNDLIITSKAYFPMSDGINDRGASRRHLTDALHASLRRLQTDFLDFYFVHHFDANTSLEETLAALNDFVRQGKILYPAVSNFAAWQIMKGLGVCRMRGWAEFAYIQPMYNLVKREAEVELLPMAESEGLGAVPYSPLAAGLLTGKYSSRKTPMGGRLVDNKTYIARYSDGSYYDTAARFAEFAAGNGYNPVSLAVAWVGSHPAVTAPIIGARNSVQLADSLAAVDIKLDAELRGRISSLSPEPPPATDRTEERTSHSMDTIPKK